MKVFLDTNVLVSALMGHGLCHDLLDRLILEHTILLGEPVRDELRRILTDKFKIPPALWQELESRLEALGHAPAVDEPRVDVRIADQADVAILACAVAAGADLIVTGDHELLDLGAIEEIPIVSPRQCWTR